jgi:hypothetical protein
VADGKSPSVRLSIRPLHVLRIAIASVVKNTRAITFLICLAVIASHARCGGITEAASLRQGEACVPGSGMASQNARRDER